MNLLHEVGVEVFDQLVEQEKLISIALGVRGQDFVLLFERHHLIKFQELQCLIFLKFKPVHDISVLVEEDGLLENFFLQILDGFFLGLVRLV